MDMVEVVTKPTQKKHHVFMSSLEAFSSSSFGQKFCASYGHLKLADDVDLFCGYGGWEKVGFVCFNLCEIATRQTFCKFDNI